MTQQTELPISAKRVTGCLASAEYWSVALPRFGDRNQALADTWAVLTGVVGALTGLAVWPVLADDSSQLQKLLISIGALATAICQLIPRVRNYAEVAAQAKSIGGEYGELVGRLTDLAEADLGSSQTQAHAVISDFQSTKARKDSLRRIPARAPEGG